MPEVLVGKPEVTVDKTKPLKDIALDAKLKISALRNWVLLKERPKDKTTGGIHIPETANSPRLAKWEVVAAGPGMWNMGVFVKTTVKPGDCVMVQPAHVIRFKVAKVASGLICEDGIIAVIEGDEFNSSGVSMIEGLDGFYE